MYENSSGSEHGDLNKEGVKIPGLVEWEPLKIIVPMDQNMKNAVRTLFDNFDPDQIPGLMVVPTPLGIDLHGLISTLSLSLGSVGAGLAFRGKQGADVMNEVTESGSSGIINRHEFGPTTNAGWNQVQLAGLLALCAPLKKDMIKFDPEKLAVDGHSLARVVDRDHGERLGGALVRYNKFVETMEHNGKRVSKGVYYSPVVYRIGVVDDKGAPAAIIDYRPGENPMIRRGKRVSNIVATPRTVAVPSLGTI